MRERVSEREGVGVDLNHAGTCAVDDVEGILKVGAVGGKADSATPEGCAIRRIQLIAGTGEWSSAHEDGIVILVEKTAGDAIAAVGNELSDDGVWNAERIVDRGITKIESAEIENVFAAETCDCEGIWILQDKGATGCGDEAGIGLNDDAL